MYAHHLAIQPFVTTLFLSTPKSNPSTGPGNSISQITHCSRDYSCHPSPSHHCLSPEIFQMSPKLSPKVILTPFSTLQLEKFSQPIRISKTYQAPSSKSNGLQEPTSSWSYSCLWLHHITTLLLALRAPVI